ncbi:putative serine/threonine-protein kinase, partial [Trifolium medium]|nr:putative serine/threonine-protein kinase [Trifolium medium]
MMQQNRSNEGTSPSIDSNHHEQHHNNVDVLYGLGDHAEELLQMLDKKA